MPQGIDEVVRSAGEAANAGRWDEAERLWIEVRRRDPENAKALLGLAVHGLQRRDFNGALSFAEAACAAAPRDILAWLTLAAVRRNLADRSGEGDAIQSALAVDAYSLPALLAKASWLERSGAAASAAMFYRSALKVAPPEPHWPGALRAQLANARDVAQRHSAEFGAHLAASVKDLEASLPAAAAERWREAVSIMAGLSTPFHADANQLHVPRLPAIPFFERERFAWAATLEAKTDAIRGELVAALRAEREEFKPYIAYQPGQPVNQWADLDHSERWSAYQLWRHGDAQSARIARCPSTAAAIGLADVAHIAGHCPNAMFSALAPHTHIPPHHGETNTRVIVHLPLIVPEGCSYRVGFEQRRWTVGEILVFDDTIEHEARNDSDELRVVLIFDIWNPLLSLAEREMTKALLAAAQLFNNGQT